MTKNEFEEILNKCCTQLTDEARTTVFKSSAQFENRVREVLADITENDETFQIDFNPHPQAFPDIAMGEYGVEVKFTLNDTWRSIANSVLETQRIDEVKHMPSAELEKTVNERGISSRTMRTAKSRIGDRLVTEKDGTAWVCYLRD